MKPTKTKHEEESRRGKKVRSLGGKWAQPTDWHAGGNKIDASLGGLLGSSKGIRKQQFPRNAGELLDFSQMLNRH